MREYDREPDFGDLSSSATAPTEWEYVRTRRRPGAPDRSLPVRTLLIDEGMRAVDEHGVRDLSVAACARRIGVSKGAPYTWFADREDFHAAVTAGLLGVLVTELTARSDPPGEEDPLARLAADVRLVVRDWAANGVGVDSVFAGGGPASHRELTWTVERFVRHLAARVHRAVGCRCASPGGGCFAQPASVDLTLAICHGYAALARRADVDPARIADAASDAVMQAMAPTRRSTPRRPQTTA